MNALDTTLTKLVSQIEAQVGECSIYVMYCREHWTCHVMQGHVDGKTWKATGDKPSDAILKAWHIAVGSEMPPF